VRYKCNRQAESFSFFPADHFARTPYLIEMTEDTRRQRRDSKRSLPRREEPYQFPLPGYASSELPPTLLGRNQRPESRPPRRLNPSERRRDRRAEESHAEEQDKEVREQRRLAQDNRYNTEADYRRRSRRRSRGPERKGFSSASSRDGHRREQSGSRNPSSKSQRSGPGSEDNFLRVSSHLCPRIMVTDLLGNGAEVRGAKEEQ